MRKRQLLQQVVLGKFDIYMPKNEITFACTIKKQRNKETKTFKMD